MLVLTSSRDMSRQKVCYNHNKNRTRVQQYTNDITNLLSKLVLGESGKMNNSSPNRETTPYNPIPWGILFFGFWLLLNTTSQFGPIQQGFAWFFLALAGLLWLSIVVPPLGRLFTQPKATSLILPIVFFVSIFGYTLSWLSSLADIEGRTLSIAIIFGFLWIIAYLLVLIRNVPKPAGIAASAFLLGIGIFQIFKPPPAESLLSTVVVIVLGAILLCIAIRRPTLYQRFPSV